MTQGAVEGELADEERILDSLTVVLFFVLVIINFPRLAGGDAAVPEVVLKFGLVFMAFALVGIIVLALLKFYPAKMVNLASKTMIFQGD